MKDHETHDGTGTGLNLRVEEVIAEALSILEPTEPYFEFHAGRGTGLDLNTWQIMGQVDALLEAAFAAIPAPEAAMAAMP